MCVLKGLKDGSSQGKAGSVRDRELTAVRSINLKPGTLVPADQEAEAGELFEPRSSRLCGGWPLHTTVCHLGKLKPV